MMDQNIERYLTAEQIEVLQIMLCNNGISYDEQENHWNALLALENLDITAGGYLTPYGYALAYQIFIDDTWTVERFNTANHKHLRLIKYCSMLGRHNELYGN
jgi:hypothetical protein